LVSTGVNLIHGGDLPLQIGVLIDVSTSQRGETYEAAVSGVSDFLNGSLRSEQDKAFVGHFSTTATLTPFLKKSQLSQVKFAQEVGGDTAVWDAVAVACAQRFGKPEWQNPTRRILIILSDGDDDASKLTLTKVKAYPIAAGVVVFGISTNYFGPNVMGDSDLRELSESSGGTAYGLLSRHDIPKIFDRIKNQIDQMYYLTYVPPVGSSKPGIHTVSLKPAKTTRLEIRAPHMYPWNP
jgi:hypothetical protein